MPQFSVYQNKNSNSNEIYPYLLDIQSDLLRDLKTTVVIPVCEFTSHSKEKIKILTPVVEINQKKYLLMTPQLAGILRSEIDKETVNLSNYRNEIISAIDFMLTGFELK
ncbi:MAG: CcdB family protein [Thermodesulfobacteriota bacterium]